MRTIQQFMSETNCDNRRMNDPFEMHKSKCGMEFKHIVLKLLDMPSLTDISP